MRHPRYPSGGLPVGGPARGKAGFTLIELLLALLIAGLVVALLYTLQHSVALTARHQAERERARDPIAATRMSLVENLQNLFLPEGQPDDGLLLEPDDNDPERLQAFAFCTLRAAESGAVDPRWASVRQVEFRVQADRHKKRLVLLDRPLTGPGSGGMATNVLLEGVTRFSVSLFDGEDWWNTWPPEPEHPRLARLARVDIEARDLPEPLRLNIYLPAGLAVEAAGNQEERSTPTP